MKKGLTEIITIIDRSGSMEPITDDTIGGFNQFLEDQKAVPGEALLTLVQFDHEYEIVYNGVNIKDVPPLTKETYIPRGMTALLDAIGKTINTVGDRLRNTPEDERPEKVIVSILTDGHENDSKEFTNTQISDIIKTQRDTYSWEFIFLGANQDSFATAQSLSIDPQYTSNFAHTGAGTRSAFNMVNVSTTALRQDATNSN